MSGSSFVYLFRGEDVSVKDKYEIVDKSLTGKMYDLWKEKYVTENSDMNSALNIDHKKIYHGTEYNMNFIIDEYLDQVRPLRRLKGLKTPLTEEEDKLLQKFFKLNTWDTLFKHWMRNRKLYGDDYTLIQLKPIDGMMMPYLKQLPAKYIEITEPVNPQTDLDFISADFYSFNYTLHFTRNRTVIATPGIGTTSQPEQEIIQILFTKGKIIPFINNIADEQNIISFTDPLSNVNPIIHLQFMRAAESLYSEIPSLNFIDAMIRLDRIETDIGNTNSRSGAPQVWVVDGDVDKRSTFGSNCIAYVDTTSGAMSKGKQASVHQLEITNGLESLYKEKTEVLEAMCSKANILPPSIKSSLAKSDSSKVVKFLSADLLDEIRTGYEEISEKTKVIWKILFPNRADEDISLEIPIDISRSSMLDKASYVAANILTVKDIMREAGKNEDEIELFMKDLNEQVQLFTGKGYGNLVPMPLSPAEIAGASITPKEPPKLAINKNIEKPSIAKPTGIDNKIKSQKKR